MNMNKRQEVRADSIEEAIKQQGLQIQHIHAEIEPEEVDEGMAQAADLMAEIARLQMRNNMGNGSTSKHAEDAQEKPPKSKKKAKKKTEGKNDG